MAKSVLELAVGTGQWDAGLKKAKSALDNFVQSNGGLSQALDKESQKMQQFVKMMGGMESSAKTAKGQMNDYKGTIEQLTMQYNRMTDAQKQAVGPDYMQAIDQLREKYQGVNEEIQEINRSLSNVKAPDINAGGDMLGGIGSKIDGALAVFGGNLMTKGFETATNAAMTFVSAIKDAAAQGLEMAKQGEGIRIAFGRLNQPDLLDELNNATHNTVTNLELMKQAVKFNDFNLPLSQMGTLLAFAQQKAKDTGQSVDYMVDSIVTGLGRQSLMILDNLGLSAAEIRERMKETGDMTTAVADIIRDRMKDAGDYVETAADRAAQADKKLKDAMEELGRAMLPLEQEGVGMWNALEAGAIKLLTNGVNEVTPALLELKGTIADIYDTITGSSAWDYYTTALSTVTSKAAEAIPVLGQLWTLIKGIRGDGTNAAGGAAVGGVLQDIATEAPKVKPKGNDKTGKSTKSEPKDEFQEIVGLIGNAQERVSDIQKQIRESWDEGEIAKLTDDLRAAEEELKRLKDIGKDVDGGQLAEVVVRGNPMVSANKKLSESPTNVQSIGDYSAAISSALKNTDIGSELYAKLSEQLSDSSLVSQLLQQYVANGITGADLSETAQELKNKLLNGEIDDDVMQQYVDQLNEKLKEKFDETEWPNVLITFDADTKKIIDAAKQQEKEAREMAKDWRAAGSAIQAVGTAMSQIENPAAKVLGTIAQAVATMAMSYAQAANSPAVTGTGWGWIAFAATGLATMLTSVNAIKQATAGFANGGVVKAADGAAIPGTFTVPGTTFSGDQIPAMLNAGETVLTRAQAGNIASQLEGGGFGNIQLEAVIGAEEIMLVTNNRGSRTQRGEYVQSNNRRG